MASPRGGARLARIGKGQEARRHPCLIITTGTRRHHMDFLIDTTMILRRHPRYYGGYISGHSVVRLSRLLARPHWPRATSIAIASASLPHQPAQRHAAAEQRPFPARWHPTLPTLPRPIAVPICSSSFRLPFSSPVAPGTFPLHSYYLNHSHAIHIFRPFPNFSQTIPWWVFEFAMEFGDGLLEFESGFSV